MTDNSSENNQRSIRAILLCVLVAVAYTQLFIAPQQRAQQQQLQQQQQQEAPSAQAPAAGAAPSSPSQVGAASVSPTTVGQPIAAQTHLKKSEVASAPTSFINLGKTQVAISHLGGRITQYKLSDYKFHQGQDEALDLIDVSDGGSLPLGLYVGLESDERVSYRLTGVNGAAPVTPTVNLQAAPGSNVVLEFKGTLSSGVGITKRITFSHGSYLFSVDVALDKPAPTAQPIWLEWSHYYSSEMEKELRLKHSLIYLDNLDKVRHVQLDQIVEGVRDYGSSKWVSLGDIYFASTLIPTVNTRNTILGREGDVFLGRVAGTPTGGEFHVYVGPKDYKVLEAVGPYSLERSIDLGWFSFLALPLLWLLKALYGLLGNYGVAIIALTLLVKTVMLPLSKASFESARKMQDLQPEIKALRDRIKDPNQLNQEIFGLYKKRGVNPMGGCFPILIQIPVFLGLYNALLNAIELRHAPFALWITDLSAPEQLTILGIGVPVMVLLMAASMVYQQWTTPMPSADPAQQKMMMLMPLIFAVMFIIFPMPAGLVLYWLVNNIISIIQQLYMRKTDKGRGSVYVGTAVASVAIFGVGFLLTLI